MDISTPRKIGKSRLAVTPLGFGGAPIGSADVSAAVSVQTVATAWDTGVRFFDTAPWYGIGRSERRIGVALEGLGARDELVLNTKVGRTLIPEPEPLEASETRSPSGQERTPRDPRSGFRVAFGYTEEHIHTQHRDSLERLGLSRVDSLTIHDLDYGYHSDEQVEFHLGELSRNGGGGARALEELRAAGAIGAIGAGCNLAARNEASWAEGKHDDLYARIADTVDLDFLVVAGGYTLLETRALDRLVPLCVERDIGVIIAAPYAGGWLATDDESMTYMYASAPSAIVGKSRRMREICAEHGVPLAAAALQFPLAHPAAAAVIPGAKSPEEARETGTRLRASVPQAIWARFKGEGLIPEDAPTPD
jgi:D-threo-aldose 1-dehydrogenase